MRTWPDNIHVMYQLIIVDLSVSRRCGGTDNHKVWQVLYAM